MGVEWKILRRVCARNSTPIGHGPSSVGQDWVTVHCGVLLRNKIRSIVTKRGEYSTRVNEGDSTYGQSVENLGGFFRPEVSWLPRESKPLVVQIIFYNRFKFSCHLLSNRNTFIWKNHDGLNLSSFYPYIFS